MKHVSPEYQEQLAELARHLCETHQEPQPDPASELRVPRELGGLLMCAFDSEGDYHADGIRLL